MRETRETMDMGDLRIDEACIACAACVSLAPEHFAIVNGRSRVLRAPVDAAERALCEAAAAACPVGAIEGVVGLETDHE